MKYLYQIEENGLRDSVCFGPFDDVKKAIKAAFSPLREKWKDISLSRDASKHTLNESDLVIFTGNRLATDYTEVFRVHIIEMKTHNVYNFKAEFQRTGSDDMMTFSFSLRTFGEPSIHDAEEQAAVELRNLVKDPAGWLLNSVDFA